MSTIIITVIVTLVVLYIIGLFIPEKPIDEKTSAAKKAPDLIKNQLSFQRGIVVFIKYKNLKGEVSERKITINSIEDLGGDYMLYTICHKSSARRNFKLSRVIELTDIESGEVHDTFEGIKSAIMY